MLAMLVLGLAPAARAASPTVYPGHFCTRHSDAPEDPFRLLVAPAAFDCSRPFGEARFSWALITGIELQTLPFDPWEVRHEYSQARAETIFVRYADGSMMQAPSDRTSARRLFSAGMQSFALPARAGRITAILIRIEGLQNQRGIAPGLQIVTGRAALDGDLVVLALYGLLAGAVVALFGYNLALYAALRYRFIFSFCLSTVALLGMGLCWSGGIFLFFPTLDTTVQISLVMLWTSALLATSALFMFNFIDREHQSRATRLFTIAAALVGLGSSVSRLVAVDFQWMLVDRLTYGAIEAVLLGMLATAALAVRRGSRPARVYLAAWTIPILLSVARVVWGVGLIGGISTLVAMSPLIMGAIEALTSSLAISWRVGLLRVERDEAQALEAELRHRAETDALTGLLNRRTFIERAMAVASDGRPRRLIVADIDQFKRVNDRFGHQAGDDVLARVARVLRDAGPPQAIVGRLGGEEFALLVSADPVDALANRLCRVVAASAGPEEHEVTISAGIADGPCGTEAEWRVLYYAADQALYRAKHGGRNRISHAPRPLAA